MYLKMFRTVSALLLVLTFSGAAWAGTFALDFNDDSAQFGYVQQLSQEAYGGSIARARLLYNDDTETLLGTVGFGVVGSPGNIPGLETGIEVSVNGSDTDSENLLAVAFGVQVDYAPPSLRGFAVTTGLSYAPKIFTFMDAEKYLETGVGIRYAIMPNASLTLAYQNILVDFEDYEDIRLDDSFRVGIRFDF